MTSKLKSLGGLWLVFTGFEMCYTFFFFIWAELFKVIFVTSVVNCGLSDYIGIENDVPRFLFWAGIYFLFVTLNVIGVQISTGIQHVLTVCSLTVLFFCYVTLIHLVKKFFVNLFFWKKNIKIRTLEICFFFSLK